MPGNGDKEQLTLLAGIAGILALLIAAMSFATWDSGKRFEPEQFNQVVVDQTLEKLR